MKSWRLSGNAGTERVNSVRLRRSRKFFFFPLESVECARAFFALFSFFFFLFLFCALKMKRRNHKIGGNASGFDIVTRQISRTFLFLRFFSYFSQNPAGAPFVFGTTQNCRFRRAPSLDLANLGVGLFREKNWTIEEIEIASLILAEIRYGKRIFFFSFFLSFLILSIAARFKT